MRKSENIQDYENNSYSTQKNLLSLIAYQIRYRSQVKDFMHIVCLYKGYKCRAGGGSSGAMATQSYSSAGSVG
jgi:hypothetical protein